MGKNDLFLYGILGGTALAILLSRPADAEPDPDPDVCPVDYHHDPVTNQCVRNDPTPVVTKKRVGVYIPAYFGTLWNTDLVGYSNKVLSLIKSNPEISFIVAINPNSGFAQSALLKEYAQAYKNNGAIVLGYISVNWGKQTFRNGKERTLAALEAEASSYANYYGSAIDGFMLDDYPTTLTRSDAVNPNVYSVMSQFNNHIRNNLNYRYVKINPGTRPAREYFALAENVAVYEGSPQSNPPDGYPSLQTMTDNTWAGQFAQKSTFVVHHGAFNANRIVAAAPMTRYISIHEQEYTSLSVSIDNQVNICKTLV